MSKIILTGDRPTGRLHLGHYVGSLRRRVELQNSGVYDKIFIMIAIPFPTHTRICLLQSAKIVYFLKLIKNMQIKYTAKNFEDKERIQTTAGPNGAAFAMPNCQHSPIA
jgi:hypothetical protein